MSGRLSLIDSKNDLLQTMSEEDQAKYLKLMQLWFQHKINKAIYDKEITKLLNKTQNELHKRFILIFLHQNMKFNKNKYLNYDSTIINSANQESVQSTPNNKINEEQLNHIDKKMKFSHDREYQFEPENCYSYLPSMSFDYNEESLLNQQKDNYLMGSIQIMSWQEGVNGAANKEVGVLIQYALNYFIKNLITTIVTKKKTFKLKGNNFICDIGKHMPNPWLQYSHIYKTQQSSRYPLDKSRNYLSEKRSLLSDKNFHTAQDESNSIQFNALKKKPRDSNITVEDILYVIMNNINNVIPLQDLQCTMYENILPTQTPE